MVDVTAALEAKKTIRALLKEAEREARSASYDAALAHMLTLSPASQLDVVQYASEALARVPADVIAARAPVQKRLAILSGATTQFIAPLIRLFALRRGVDLTIYESEFGVFEQEVWSTSPALLEFAPDVIHFCTCSENLGLKDGAGPAERIDAEARRFASLYAAAAERFRCSVIANTFETAAERPWGTLDVVTPGARNSMIRALNARLAASLSAPVYFHDVEALSAEHGKRRWFDARLWHAAKSAVSFDCQPYYADALAAAIAALFGKSKKCLVLDLDNTLWGGVIGDDGLGGIQLGAGQPAGEAFVAFQRYCKALQERGVLLAVASKNERDNALAPFREHPGMLLKESDISCFVANWERKDQNLEAIARHLNIGVDALVFFDDNPVERDLVRRGLPAVAVVDVPEDPAFYVEALHAANLFDTVSVTTEDLQRTAFFRGSAEREEMQKAAGSYDDYLRQLEMTAHIEPFTESNVVRVTQLINKTNQWNLTTRRMTEAEVRAAMGAANTYTSTNRLVDRFGDNGLISVVIGVVAGDGALDIETWLMSCRVLKRGVEQLDFARIVDFCKARGIRQIRGRFLPTAKNKLVEDHYASLGFRALPSDGEGTRWICDVADAAPAHFIKVMGA